MGCQRTVKPFSRSRTRQRSGFEVGEAKGEGAAAAAGGLGVQAEK
jgi:hypothetical protein